MKKIFLVTLALLIASTFAFAEEVTSTSSNGSNNVSISTLSATSTTPVNSNGIPTTFVPLAAADSTTGMIMPNEDTDNNRKLLFGAFLEFFFTGKYWELKDDENNPDNLIAGGSLNFVISQNFNSYLNVGAILDGKHMTGEFGVEGVVSSFSQNGYEGITRYSTSGPEVSNTFAVQDNSYHCMISLGASALCFIPVKSDAFWAVTPRGNVTFTYATNRSRKFTFFAKVSPGATLCFTGEKQPDVQFHLGVLLGASFKLF